MCFEDPPKPPDMSGLSAASLEIAKLQQQSATDQLNWAKEQDTMNRATLDRVLGVQLPAMEDQANWAKEDRARYTDVFRPLEDQFIEEAQGYDTEERREQAQGAAVSGVSQAFDAQRRNALQRLEGYGVDPSQTRNAALDVGVRMQQAAASAGAATTAKNRVEDVGRAMRGDAINMGKGMASQAAAGYAGAGGMGSSAIGGMNQTTGTSSGAMNSAIGQYGGAQAGFANAGNIMTQGYQNSMQGYDAKNAQTAGMLSGIGGIAGMAGLADGGDVSQQSAIPFQDTGNVPEMGMGDGSGIDDTVPAKLSEGEYVIPADVVKAKGMEFFDKLVAKYHTPAAEQRSMQ